jgi:hypothetical protein
VRCLGAGPFEKVSSHGDVASWGLPLCAAVFRDVVIGLAREGRSGRDVVDRATNKGIWWMPWH